MHQGGDGAAVAQDVHGTARSPLPDWLRPLGPAEIRHVLRLGAFLYMTCGLSILQLWATATSAVAHPTAYLVSGLLVMGVAGTLLVVERVAPDEAMPRVHAVGAPGLLFGGAVAVPVILWLVGFASFAIGSVVYVLPMILGVYLLTRRAVVVLMAMIVVGHAVLLAVSDDVVAPVSQYLFLIAVLIAAGVLVGGLVSRLDDAARSEEVARAELARANAALASRVDAQVGELERLGRLRRFLSPQVADAVVSGGAEHLLAAHRREIVVFFVDLRGFTTFAGSVEPEEVIAVLDGYYTVVGEQLAAHGATTGQIAGDGIMAFLNDPTPCDDPARTGIGMALAVRDGLRGLRGQWAARGYELGYGIGVAMGHATLGVVGFEGRSEYTPLGTAVNRGARLCDEAKDGQILVDQRVRSLLDDRELAIGDLPPVPMKGFASPVPVFEVHGPRTEPVSPGRAPSPAP